jgi:hypothetical protein
MNCSLCGCAIYPGEDETFDSQFGIVDVLCYRALEIHGRVWD